MCASLYGEAFTKLFALRRCTNPSLNICSCKDKKSLMLIRKNNAFFAQNAYTWLAH